MSNRALAGLHPGSVAPEGFAVVSLTDIRAHDMDDDIKKIQNDPGGVQFSIHCSGADIMLIPEFVQDFIHNGAKVRIARAGGDYEVIRYPGKFTYVQDDDV